MIQCFHQIVAYDNTSEYYSVALQTCDVHVRLEREHHMFV